eukprot:2214368-Alexandrium_andersonii.AAC.1
MEQSLGSSPDSQDIAEMRELYTQAVSDMAAIDAAMSASGVEPFVHFDPRSPRPCIMETLAATEASQVATA